jgi:predicted Zn-ribbon and HTH transcriptional regulator
MPAPALHLLHGWWVASCPDCGYELGRSRDQERAERVGERRRCPICRPEQATEVA